MRFERPSPGPGEAGGGRFKRHGAKIDWRYVGVQVVVASLLTWAPTVAMAGVFVAASDRGFLASFRLSALIMAVVIIGLGIVEAAGGPVPMSMGSGEGVDARSACCRAARTYSFARSWRGAGGSGRSRTTTG